MHQLNLLLVFTESASMYYYLLRPIQQLLLHMLQLQQRFYLRPIFSWVEVVKLTLDLQKIKHDISENVMDWSDTPMGHTENTT